MNRLLAILVASLTLFAAVSCSREKENSRPSSAAAKPTPTATITLKVAHDATGKALAINKALAAEFTKETGISVEFLSTPNDTNERLNQYLNFLGAKSDAVDVYMADVIWAGVLGEHFVDLKSAYGAEVSDFFPEIIANNTYQGRLVLAPYYADAPMLYYRSDLLAKHGFNQPPATWAQLEEMAAAIQKAERAAGNDSFWGYVWQGRAYEGLTCNMLEWHTSVGGGLLVDVAGNVDVGGAAMAAMLTRVAGWTRTISPPGVTNYGEEESRAVWHSGNAAFMRNWPYAYALSDAAESPVKGRFAVTTLPAGEGPNARSAATLGGQMLAVSAYSAHRDQAVALVRYLTSREAQTRRALEGGYLPTRASVYDDPAVAAALPYLPMVRKAFESSVARPATALGTDYNEASSIYSQAGHKAITGESAPADALATAAADITRIVQSRRAR